jgi:hypothetical protein
VDQDEEGNIGALLNCLQKDPYSTYAMAKLSSEYIKKKDYRTAAKWQHREIGIFAGWGVCNEHDLLNNVIQLAY